MSNVIETIGNAGVLPVVNVPNKELAVPLAKALLDGGLTALEVTLRSADSLESIKAIKEACPQLVLGAGTVLTVDIAKQAIAAGVDYVVSPGYDTELIDFCLENGMPIVPGCSNPSEIQDGLKRGLTVFKFFPSELSGGVDAIKLISGPFPQAKFLPTGGITFANLSSYLSLPCVLACGGSFMAPAAMVKNGEFDKITDLCKKSVDISLGFELAHVGVNHKNGDDALKTAEILSDIFRFATRKCSASSFAGTAVECMNHETYGDKGHIGFSTISMPRAMKYLADKGIEFDEGSIKRDAAGNITCIYFKEQVAGFALHIVKK